MTVALLRAHFPLWPPTLNIYAVSAVNKSTHQWHYGCYEQAAFSCVNINMINMLNYSCYSHKCSSGNGILIKTNHQSPICGFSARSQKSVITANAKVIQRLLRNMDDDLPPCETTACFSLFPRLFLDVLWLWASVIMPRSWLLDGFSTIRPHYSSLGLSCLSPHPS